MKKLIEWLWWNFAANIDDKIAVLEERHRRMVWRDHVRRAEADNYVGHTSLCCSSTRPVREKTTPS